MHDDGKEIKVKEREDDCDEEVYVKEEDWDSDEEIHYRKKEKYHHREDKFAPRGKSRDENCYFTWFFWG